MTINFELQPEFIPYFETLELSEIIEVKAGTTDQLKSLKIFLDEKNLNFGICISQFPLSLEGPLLSIPLYMVGEIDRLMRENDILITD